MPLFPPAPPDLPLFPLLLLLLVPPCQMDEAQYASQSQSPRQSPTLPLLRALFDLEDPLSEEEPEDDDDALPLQLGEEESGDVQ